MHFQNTSATANAKSSAKYLNHNTLCVADQEGCGWKGSKISLMLSLISNRPERYFKSSFWKAAISNSYTHDIYTRVYRLGLLETEKGIQDLHIFICKNWPWVRLCNDLAVLG